MKEVKFSYSVQTWKKQFVIRTGPSKIKWHLFFSLPADLGLMHFLLDHDIRKSKQTTAFELPCPDADALDRGTRNENKRYLRPNEKGWWNPSKNTPSQHYRIATGTAIFYINEKNFKKFLLKSKDLKGLFTLTREESSPLFVLKHSAGPGQKRI